MKLIFLLGAGLFALFALSTPVEANNYVKYLGQCQKTGYPIYAYWQPVECTNGCVEYRWVTQKPSNCRPAYKGRKKKDCFKSWWFNPANAKRNQVRDESCGPYAVNHSGYSSCN